MITRLAEIWEAMQAEMPTGEWVDLQTIYSLIERRIQLKSDDFLPAGPNVSQPKWKRNVRNVLQARKEKGDIVWLRGGRYMLPITKDSIQESSCLRLRSGLREADFLKLQERRREIGLEGELFVLELERNALIADNMPDLARNVRRVSEEDIGLGYDIESFNSSGQRKCIEVKTTTTKGNTFELTRTELQTAHRLKDTYWIYFVRDIGGEHPMITRIQNPAKEIGVRISLEPSAYTASLTSACTSQAT